MGAPSLPILSNECLNALVLEIAKVMMGKVFCRDVYPQMTIWQRAHLWALRSQALFGDAPDENFGGAAAKQSGGREGDASHGAFPLTMSADGQIVPLVKPRWYEITNILYYRTWVGLRGAMSPQVAAETFCSEFFYLLKLYPVPTMLPIMDAVLSTAGARLAVVQAAGKKTLSKLIALKNGFYLSGCYDDPAAIAFLWLCRTYCIPCEAQLQPISAQHTPQNNYHFLVKSVECSTVISEPLAAFLLCVKLHLPQSEHWLGVVPGNGATASRAVRAAQKSIWLEYMQNVLLELRGPLLKFMRNEREEEEHFSASERGNSLLTRNQKNRVRLSLGSPKKSRRRRELLKHVDEGLGRYEKISRYYYSTRLCPVVSVAELLVAAHAYVVFTSPACEDIIPLQEAVPSSTGRADFEVPSQWSRKGSYYSVRGGVEATLEQVPKPRTLINGVPKECQEIATLILSGAKTEHEKSHARSQLNEIIENNKNAGGENLLSGMLNLLTRNYNWKMVECRTNMLASKVIDTLIYNRCIPVRPKLGKILSYVWRTANEQCEGFPFIVLSKDLRSFVTTLTGHTSPGLYQMASRSDGHTAAAVAQMYWERLREAFSGASTPSESRTYHNYTSKM